MKRKTMITLALLSALGASTAARAVDSASSANSRLIGQNQYWTVGREIATCRRLRAISIPRRC